MTRSYRLHGLLVRSDVPIDAAEAPAGAPDLHIRWGARRPIPDAEPAGDLVAVMEQPARSWLTMRGDGGYTVRLSDLCDFEIDAELRTVTARLRPGVDEGLAAILIGSVLSSVLALRGHTVLHASAVEADAGVIAFVGSSGTGKSTVAALCCAAGARLVSDDVLRVERGGDSGWCFRGSRELRLRAQATGLAEALGGVGRRSTIDNRLALAPALAGPGRLPLAAIVAPVPDRRGGELELQRLRGGQALVELLRHPRSVGWVGTDVVQRDFETLASLAEVVPVLRARLPWGPPFAPEWGRRLLADLGHGDR